MIELKQVQSASMESALSISFRFGNIYVLKGNKDFAPFFSILSGEEEEYDGEFIYQGRNLNFLSKKEKEKIFRKFYYFSGTIDFIEKFTVLENLLFVCEEKSEIEFLAKKWEIESLLQKYPKELTHFEKIKISYLRALLLGCQVFLFLEPTSSLTKEKTQKFLELLQETKNEESLILILTDKDIYDSWCDQVYVMEKGKCSLKGKAKVKKEKEEILSLREKKKNFSMHYESIYAKRYKEPSWKQRTVFLFLFLSIFFLFSCYQRKKEIVFGNFYQKFPVHVVSIEKKNYANVVADIKKVYEDYQIEGEDRVSSLLEEDDYGLKEDVVKEGSFPSFNNEVLVNEEYQKEKKVSVGSTVLVGDYEFVISGIIDSSKEIFSPYYPGSVEEPTLFMSYEMLEKIGTKKEHSYLVVALEKDCVDAIYQHHQYEEEIVDNPWMSLFEEQKMNVRREFMPFFFSFVILVFGLTIGWKKTLFSFFQKKKEEMPFFKQVPITKDRLYFIFLVFLFYEIRWSYLAGVLTYVGISLVMKIPLMHLSSFVFISLLSFLYIFFVWDHYWIKYFEKNSSVD